MGSAIDFWNFLVSIGLDNYLYGFLGVALAGSIIGLFFRNRSEED